MTNEKRGLKTRTTLSNAVDTKLLERFKKLSVSTRIPQSKLLDEALEMLLDKYEKE